MPNAIKRRKVVKGAGDTKFGNRVKANTSAKKVKKRKK